MRLLFSSIHCHLDPSSGVASGPSTSLDLMRRARWVAGAENAPSVPALEQPEGLLWRRYVSTTATHNAGVKPE